MPCAQNILHVRLIININIDIWKKMTFLLGFPIDGHMWKQGYTTEYGIEPSQPSIHAIMRAINN
jgi:hypothetical protein